MKRYCGSEISVQGEVWPGTDPVLPTNVWFPAGARPAGCRWAARTRAGRRSPGGATGERRWWRGSSLTSCPSAGCGRLPSGGWAGVVGDETLVDHGVEVGGTVVVGGGCGGGGGGDVAGGVEGDGGVRGLGSQGEDGVAVG